jgi:hypothetical protein
VLFEQGSLYVLALLILLASLVLWSCIRHSSPIQSIHSPFAPTRAFKSRPQAPTSSSLNSSLGGTVQQSAFILPHWNPLKCMKLSEVAFQLPPNDKTAVITNIKVDDIWNPNPHRTFRFAQQNWNNKAATSVQPPWSMMHTFHCWF